MCKLWTAVGKLLDREKAVDYINYYFRIIQHHSQTYHDVRIQFMLAVCVRGGSMGREGTAAPDRQPPVRSPAGACPLAPHSAS